MRLPLRKAPAGTSGPTVQAVRPYTVSIASHWSAEKPLAKRLAYNKVNSAVFAQSEMPDKWKAQLSLFGAVV
jgi:hypothetical protein